MRKWIIFFALGFVIYSCSDPKVTNPYLNNMGIAPATLAALDTPNYTRITWLDSVQNFGEIKTGDTAIIRFRFINSGKTPLFITEVVSSCGCAVADYPRDMVSPGDEGVVSAKFDPEDYVGPIRKSLHITTNTSNSRNSTLIFFGHVIANGITQNK